MSKTASAAAKKKSTKQTRQEVGPAMWGRDILVEALEREGVEVIFAYPGGASMEIHQSLTQSKKIRTILPRHEQGGSFAAEGYARATGKNLTAAEVVMLSESGDAPAEASMLRYIDRLARATATVINLIDPHIIVLGGGVSKVGRLYTEVPKLWPRYVFSDTVVTKLLPPVHGDAGGVRGAAWLWP